MISLYQIEQDHLQLVEQLIENGGELTPELEQALALNKENLTTKGTNYAFVIRDLSGDVDKINAEIERLEALKKSRVNTIDRLKNALLVAMKVFEVEKIEGPIMNISLRKSKQVVIDNEAQIPRMYKIWEETFTPDKKQIKQAIDAGLTVPGARLQENKSIQIK